MKNFDWTLVDPTNPWRSTAFQGVFAQDNLWVAVTTRET
jgi:hypothetical protein